MFDYHSELVISRMERERQIKTLELRRLRRWLAFSERLDRLIESSGTAAAARSASAPLPAPAPAPLPAPTRRPVGVRATLAVRLARLARAVHAEAAATAVLESEPR